MTLIDRRRLLAGLAGLGLACASRGRLTAAPRELVVLTSYPEPVLSAFEAAFEKTYPQYRLNIVWRMPHDAAVHLSKPAQGGVDVYWAASPRTFARLDRQGAWQPLGIDPSGLPEHIGALPLAGPNDHYRATEIAGYGFACQRDALQALGVETPRDWHDLADPRLAGRIALPVPSRVGFAPPMVDIVLGAYGWERGWALWSEIAGLAYLVDRGSTFISDEVDGGRAAVGLTIDFFVAAAIAGGAPLDFIYPAHGGLNPGQIAISASTDNLDAARAFASFVLSASGQRLLAGPDIRKLPVRPAVYAELPAGYHDPFAAAAQGAYDYRSPQDPGRLGLISALFEQMLIAPHDTLRAHWARLHRREAERGQRLENVRALLSQPPIDAAQADDPALLAGYRARLEGAAGEQAKPEHRWAERRATQLAEAGRLLARLT